MAKVVSVLILFLLFLGFRAAAQEPEDVLQIKTTVSVKQVTIEDLLLKISESQNVYFAYNSTKIKADSVLNYSCQRKAIEQVLVELFPVANYSFTTSGRHIIIYKTEQQNRENKYQIKGTVVDKNGLTPISNAAVYDIEKQKIYVTDKQGKFKIKGSTKKEKVTIAFRHSRYKDQVLLIDYNTKEDQKIQLEYEPPVQKIEPKKYSTKSFIFTPPDSLYNPKPIEDLAAFSLLVPDPKMELMSSLYMIKEINSPVQFSVWPGVSTNSLFSSQSSNNVSINLLAGYSKSVKGVEIGSLVNIVKEDVEGVQVGGVANLVGGDIEGVQIGGISNITRGHIEGAQIGGFTNYAKSVRGAQIAGYVNANFRRVEGVQIAGFVNAAQDVYGAQLSGFVNVAKDTVSHVQATGFVNVCGGYCGIAQLSGYVNAAMGAKIQATGFVNVAGTAGAQLSGFVNAADKVNIQATGFVNIAKEVKYLQIALFNYADTSSGASIGLLNIVRKGYHEIEVGSGTDYQATVSLKTGTNKFYNIFQVNRLKTNSTYIAPAYGFGTQPMFTKRIGMNIDITAGILFDMDNLDDQPIYGHNAQLKFLPTYYPFKKVAFFAGPVINFYSQYLTGFVYETYPETPFRNINSSFFNSPETRVWGSIQAGIRF